MAFGSDIWGDSIGGLLNVTGSAAGKVDSTSNDFIGVDADAVEKYIGTIVAEAIKAAITKIKAHDELFRALEDGWSGQSLKNFENNFIEAEKALVTSLNKAYAALVQEIVAIANGMVEQDHNMVAKY